MEPERIDCDARLAPAELAMVERLARMQLVAREHGFRMRLHNASPELIRLLELCGLCEAFGLPVGGRLDPRRQAEHREEARGIEEEGDPADSIA